MMRIDREILSSDPGRPLSAKSGGQDRAISWRGRAPDMPSGVARVVGDRMDGGIPLVRDPLGRGLLIFIL